MADRQRFVGRWPFAAGRKPNDATANDQRPTANGFFWLIVAILTLLGVIRVASTHLVFAQTLDEPIHVAAGHEWLTRGTYQLDFEHPPVSRVLFALPFVNARAEHFDDQEYGNDLFAQGDRYIHNLARARRGNLVFLIIACIAIAAIARKMFGDVVAWLAVALFLSLPPVLAHAGLATTDLAGVAAFSVAFYALLVWCDDPSWQRTFLLGAAIGFAICCKYSFPIFFPPAMIVMLIARSRFSLRKLLVAGVLAMVLVWGVFGFSIGTMERANPKKARKFAELAGLSPRIVEARVPAPNFFLGLIAIQVHNRNGHLAYLLGHLSNDGWWYYFPIALAVKTPIPFLLLCLAVPIVPALRNRRASELLIIAASILAIAMTSRINIGVRHLLPMYVPLSIVAAHAAFASWQRFRLVAIACVAWLAIGSALAHPDYLPWMNAFAGRHPENVLLDSNFEWGQDLWRFARVCRARGITNVGYKVTTNVRGSSIGINSGYILDETKPGSGWIVISEQDLVIARVRNPSAYLWLTRGRDFERVGKTLRLYYVKSAIEN